MLSRFLSSNHHRRSLARAGCLIASLLVAPSARAQTSPEDAPSPGAAAIEKGREALAHFQQGEWARARDLFHEANALYHSPVLVVYEARSQRKLGKLLEARKLFQGVASATLDPTAPPTWLQAKAEAAAELESLAAEIPSIKIVVDGATRDVHATIDGALVPQGFAVEQDPGEHRVVVVDGLTTLSQRIDLLPTQVDRRVLFHFATKAPDRKPTAPPVEPSSAHSLRVLGVVLTAVGATGVVLGGAMGGVALSKAADARKTRLPESCTAAPSCPTSDRARTEATFQPAYTFASLSDGLLIGGGLTAAAGVLVLILDPRHKGAAAHAWRGGGSVMVPF